MRETYTHGHHESVLRSHQWRTLENSAAYLVDHLRPGSDVVDIGCGPGTVTLDVARVVAPGRAVGVDVVGEPLTVARREARDRGDETTQFVVGDVYRLAISDASFDVVHAHQLLQHLSDPVAALKEMRRVCRPGGVVAARDADYAAMTWHPQSPGLSDWLQLYRDVARGNGAEPDAGRRLLSWAHEAGMDDVESTASVWCFATEDDRRWWGGLWADRTLSSAFAQQALARGLADQDQLEAMALAWRDWMLAEDGWFAVLNGEILCYI